MKSFMHALSVAVIGLNCGLGSAQEPADVDEMGLGESEAIEAVLDPAMVKSPKGEKLAETKQPMNQEAIPSDGTTPQIDASQQSFRGRLPQYFAKLINARQRQEIYDIQRTFLARNSDLEQQLAELKQQEMAQIESLLSPLQKERLVQLRSDAKDRSRAKSMASDASPRAELAEPPVDGKPRGEVASTEASLVEPTVEAPRKTRAATK